MHLYDKKQLSLRQFVQQALKKFSPEFEQYDIRPTIGMQEHFTIEGPKVRGISNTCSIPLPGGIKDCLISKIVYSEIANDHS